MSAETLIKVEGVSKKFCRNLKKSLWYGIKDLGGELLGHSAQKNQLRPEEFWAVKDVSFELKRGECLGLVGHNGAGKSTLLKMLNGLIKPDYGRITMKGRIGALIELNAGFNPILTGRENVYIYGSILGFTKKEIVKKYKLIVEFAEIEEFMEMPVQSYSSGMKVRLGFAVAAQMEPDVLLIDEILAVGDTAFRKKSINRILELANKASIIFVSHSIPTVARIADRIISLNRGDLVYSGLDKTEAIKNYYRSFNTNRKTFWGIGRFSNAIVETYNKNYDRTKTFNNGEIIKIKITLKGSKDPISCNINITFTNQLDSDIAILDSSPKAIMIVNETSIIVEHKCLFSPGKYYLNLNVNQVVNGKQSNRLYHVTSATHIDVVSSNLYGEIPIQIDSNWQIDSDRSYL